MHNLSLRLKGYLGQALKTGIAAVASLALAGLFRLPESYWAAISAVVVMQSNIGAAVSAGWTRLAGTAVGAIVAVGFVTLWGQNLFSFGAAVAVAILICVSLKLVDSYRLAGVTVAIIMLIGGRAGPAWVIAFHRFVEVSVGIVVALLVSTLVWPSRARKDLHRGIADSFLRLDALFQAVVRRYRGERDAPVDGLRSRVSGLLRQNEGLLKQTAYEPSLGTVDTEFLALLIEHVNHVFFAIEALEPAAAESAGDTIYREFEPEFGGLIGGISAAMGRLAEEVSAGRFGAAGKELVDAADALERKALSVRTAGITTGYRLEEILRFFSFLLGLRKLAKELEMVRSSEERFTSAY